MIQVVLGRLSAAEGDVIVRPVSTELEAVTHESRVLEIMAGEDVVERFQASGTLPVGGAAITPGGKGMGSGFLIHVAVHSLEEPATEAGIRKGLVNTLRRAAEWELESLACGPLGTGAGHLDAETSARIMVDVLREHMRNSEYPRRVTIVVSGEYEEEAFTQELGRGPATL